MKGPIDVPYILDRLGVAMGTIDTAELSLLPSCEIYAAQVGPVMRFSARGRGLVSENLRQLQELAKKVDGDLMVTVAREDAKDEKGVPTRFLEVSITMGVVKVEREGSKKNS